MIVGVLALQGDVREHLRALEACGARAHPVRRPDELDDVDALVVPGGESTTMSKLAIDFGVLEPVRKRIAGGMPTYGSCAGMIMLATEVLDGRPDQRGFDGIEMTVRRNAFGRQVDSFEAEVPIDEIDGGPFHAIFIRAPWVERVGPDVRVLGRVTSGADAIMPGQRPSGTSASSGAADAMMPGQRPSGTSASSGAADAIMPGQRPSGTSASSGAADAGRIVAVRQQHLLATAFHPELTGDLRMHRYFVEMATGAGQTTED